MDDASHVLRIPKENKEASQQKRVKSYRPVRTEEEEEINQGKRKRKG